ncbi:MAG: DoxX family protein, partial [Thermomicrobiaceae bacterium]|nr:DoxX family protein [Thermomicrobiaceae bacterium]
MTTRETSRATVLQDPPLARFIFEDTRFAWVWLIVRLYVGYEWVHAGYEKLQSPAWMDGGAALQGFWTRVTQVPPQGQPPITYGWYRDFLTYMLEHGWYTWFAPLVAITET